MTSFTSGTLVYWNSHAGFGQIELDSKQSRIGIYRTDLLRAGVKAPQIGDRFHVSTDVADTAPAKPWSRLFDFSRRTQ
jgi:hypothetical protein